MHSVAMMSATSMPTFYVVPQDGQWRIAKIGGLFKGPYPTKDEAIKAAQVMALLTRPSQVLVCNTAGVVETESVFLSDS